MVFAGTMVISTRSNHWAQPPACEAAVPKISGGAGLQGVKRALDSRPLGLVLVYQHADTR